MLSAKDGLNRTEMEQPKSTSLHMKYMMFLQITHNIMFIVPGVIKLRVYWGYTYYPRTINCQFIYICV